MARSFTDAIGYVARNEDTWFGMIGMCWEEWRRENIVEQSDSQDPAPFIKMALEKYGIKAYIDYNHNRWDYHIVDPVKYTFFQIKYSQ